MFKQEQAQLEKQSREQCLKKLTPLARDRKFLIFTMQKYVSCKLGFGKSVCTVLALMLFSHRWTVYCWSTEKSVEEMHRKDEKDDCCI
jgi:hypothetical protein